MMTPALVITGPTASGKGGVALEVARRTGAEIVSLDSMKVYREIDIATAKPSREVRAEAVCHLIDIVGPEEDFSLADYLAHLDRVLREVAERGGRAVIAGGTALYLKALVSGVNLGTAADWELRARLIDEASRTGTAALHERLRRTDPLAAARIDPGDLRRIVRALEVGEKTGQPISGEWTWGKESRAAPHPPIFGIGRDRPELYRRIDLRVERMAACGLFEEASRLLQRVPPLSRTASQFIGFREIREGIPEGRSRDEIIERVQRSTRRFAKRQLTWFRKLPIEWLPAGEGDDPQGLAEEIIARARW